MSKLRRRGRRPILFVILFIILAWVTLILRPSSARSQEGEETPVPETIPAGEAVSIEGQVEPQAFVALAPESGGRVMEILVEEGEAVEAGQALLRLDDEQQSIALAQAQSQLDAVQASLEAARTQQAQAEAAVETAQARADVAAAQLALVQSEAQAEEIAAAESRLAAAQSAVAQAVATRDALLESVGTDSQIQAARADVAAANAELRTLEEQYETIIDTCFDTPEGEICPLYGPVEESTRAQLQAAQARADAAQTALERLQEGPTEAQERAARAGVSAAIARRDQAQAQLALLRAGATEEEVQQVEVALAIAEAQVDATRAGVGEAQAAVAKAEAAVQAAQAGVAAAELALARTSLEAPFAGVALRVDVNLGELATPQVPVVTLADTGRWLVKTRNLTELDVARIAEGDTALVSFDALPDARVEGTITAIALNAGMDRGDVVYETTIALPEDVDLPLRWGMTAVVGLQG